MATIFMNIPFPPLHLAGGGALAGLGELDRRCERPGDQELRRMLQRPLFFFVGASMGPLGEVGEAV